METTIFLAKLLGMMMLISALGILVNIKNIKKLIDGLFKNPALMYVTGMFIVLMGLIMVFVHNDWGYDWTVIITIIAWLTVAKGIFFVVLPDAMKTLVKSAGGDSFYVLGALLALVLGGYLSYMGFYFLA